MSAVAALALAWTTLIYPTPGASVLVNRTVDDELGDSFTGAKPTYEPDDGWAPGAQCPVCNIHPGIVDVSKPFDKTWHDSTYHPGGPDRVINVTFNGTAVYVFNLIANNFTETTTLTNLSFFLDDEPAGQYVHAPDNSQTVLYRQLVYSNSCLIDTQHLISIRASGSTTSLVLFDYIVYTTNSVSPSPRSVNNTSSSSAFAGTTTNDPSLPSNAISVSVSQSKFSAPIGAIVGGTVGGVVVVLLIAIWVWLARRRPRQPNALSAKIEPFPLGGGGADAPPAIPPVHRVSRIPILPDFWFGRTRLIPGPSSTTTDSASSTVPFIGHRPLLPPASAAEANKSNQLQENLVHRIQALEAQMRALETEQQPVSSRHRSRTRAQASGSGSSQSSPPASSPRGRSRTRTPHHTGLRADLASLRTEIAELRAELEHDQQLLAEAAPLYMR